MDAPPAKLAGVVLSTPDPRAQASFYEALLGLTRIDAEDEWVRSGPADGSRPSFGFE